MNKPINEKEAAFRRVRVNHPKQQEALAEIWHLLEMGAGEPKIIELAGPTGVGKTNLIDLVKWQAGERLKTDANAAGRMPFLNVSAAPPQHETFRFPGFFMSILLAGDDALTPKRQSIVARLASDQLQLAAVNLLRHRKPMVFCVDEAQHLGYAIRKRKLEQNLDLIKWVATESHCPILLAGTYDLLRFGLLSAQLGRRTKPVYLEPYAYDSDIELKQFLDAARFFAQRLPLPLAFDVRSEQDFLYECTVGAIGILKPWFDDALHRAYTAGRRSVTKADFEKGRESYGKIEQMLQEIDEGRKLKAILSGDRSAARVRMGMDTKKERAPRDPSAPKPGQRKLVRDPVGLEDEAA